MKKWIMLLLILTLTFVLVGCGGGTDDPDDPDDPKDPIDQTEVLPESINISGQKETMTVGDTLTLTAEVLPATTTNKNLAWKSSNDAVVKVDSVGGITAIGAGTATITATSRAKSSIKTEVTITVVAKKIEVESLTISGKTEVMVGKTISLYVAALPAGASKDVTWTSSDTKIATISDNGVVTGVAEGTVKVTATSVENTAIIAEYNVTIKPFEDGGDDPIIKPTSIDIDGVASITEGYSTRYIATVQPAGADQTVTWHSRKEEVATINDKGVLSAISVGTTYIYAVSVADPTVQSAYLKVTVKADEYKNMVYPDLQGYVISLMNASSELESGNPFSDKYTASDKMAKQQAWTDVQDKYHCTIKLTAYPDEAPWGADRYNWINAQAAAGTPQADFYVVAAEWLPTFYGGKSCHDVTEVFDRYGRGQIETFQRQVGTYKKSLYIATTGLSATRTYVIDGLFYNYGMVKKYNLTSPAELFNNGEWTYSKYVEWCLAAQAVLPDGNYVMSGAPQLMWAGMVQAGGVKLADNVAMKLNLNHAYSISAIQTLQQVYAGGAWDKEFGFDQAVAVFQEGKAIFQPGEYWFVRATNRFPSNLWGEGSTEYGYVPFPRPDSVTKEKSFINGVGDSVYMMAEGRSVYYPTGVTYDDVYRAVIDMFINTTMNQAKDPTFDAEAIKRQAIEAKLDDPASVDAMLFYTGEKVLFDPIFDGLTTDWSNNTELGYPGVAVSNCVKNNTDPVTVIDSLLNALEAHFVATYA